MLVLVHGSAVDVAWAEASPRVGAILSAFYPGQMVRVCASDPHFKDLTLTPHVVSKARSGKIGDGLSKLSRVCMFAHTSRSLVVEHVCVHMR